MGAEETLLELGIELPEPPSPVGAYLPAVRTGNLLFVSGVLPLVDGRVLHKGKLGFELGTEEGYEAAGVACLNALAIIRKELGSLNRVKRVVKVTGYVASASSYYEQPKVVNGASELLQRVFGDAGRHARAAVGCISLPMNAPVEIEMIVEVE